MSTIKRVFTEESKSFVLNYLISHQDEMDKISQAFDQEGEEKDGEVTYSFECSEEFTKAFNDAFPDLTIDDTIGELIESALKAYIDINEQKEEASV